MTKLQEDLQDLLNKADYSMPIIQHRLALHQPPNGFVISLPMVSAIT